MKYLKTFMIINNNIAINIALIQALKESGFGCWSRLYYHAGCILFADDIYYCLPRCLSYRVCYLCIINFQFSGNYRLIAKNVMCFILVLRCLLHLNWSLVIAQ